MSERGASKFEQVSTKNSSLLGEIVGFMRQNKKFWLIPILLCFVLIGAVALLSTTAAAPFIYTLF